MLMPRRFAMLAVSLVLLGLTGCGSEGAGAASPESAGESAATASLIPTFASVTLDGTEFNSVELEGRPSVLWFWAPWCSTCRAEAPNIASAAVALAGEVEVIGVAALGPVPDMQTFVDDTNLTGLRHLADEDAQVWADFGVAAQPAFAFIGADGSIDVVQGSLGADQIVERAQQLS